MISDKELSISIVIVNYNYGRFLRACIESALSQSRSPLEILVVDDESSDTSIDVLREYEGKISILVKQHGGHVEAVNAGFDKCKGDLCMFLDADDLLYTKCLEEVSRNWEAGDVKLQFRLDTIDEDGVDQYMQFPYFSTNLTPEDIRQRSFASGVYPWTVSSGCVFARSFLAQLLPIDSAEIYRSPDGYLSKVAPLFGNVRSLDKVLGAYRVHGRNAWAQSHEKFDVTRIARWVKFDLVLQAKFESLAREKGLSVVSAENVRSVQQSEYRMILKRLDPSAYPYKQDTNLSLFRVAIESALSERDVSVLGRLFWILWFTCLLVLPAGLVQRIYRAIRGQSGRSSLAKFLVRLSRETKL